MINLYVSKTGSDNNSGSIEKPFETLERASKEAYSICSVIKDSVIINVCEGTYYLDKPLVFKAMDNGDKDFSIEFRAIDEKKTTISGGRQVIGNWEEYSNGIMVCKLQQQLDKIDFSQLFINGKRQILARYPNYDASEPGVSGYIHPAKAELEWPNTKFKYDANTFSEKKWAKPQEAIVHIFGGTYWGNLQWQVTGIDYNSQTIILGNGGFQINDVMQGKLATGIDHRSRYFIENVFEELDSPGEWYFDKQTRKLYVMPEEGVDLNTALIEIPVLDSVIRIHGSQHNPVRNTKFTGFRIAHTNSTFLKEYEALSLGDWTIHRGGAVLFEGAENCTIENCFFDAVGGNAIFINNYNKRIIIDRNIITEAGDSAICVVGSKQFTIGSNHKYPSEVKITNNLIHDIGIFGKQTAGVFISVSQDNFVSHNHIYNLPRAAICINDGTWGGHVIEYNDIHDTVRETGDHGPFNSWGRERFWCYQQSHGPDSHEAGDVKLDCRKTTIIRNNRFEDYSGWGIDLDDGSSNFHVYNNLCIGVSIKLREGDYRTIENNIFINGANPPGFHIGYENNHDRFERNIVVMSSEYDNPEVDINFEKGKSAGKVYEIIGPPIKGNWFEKLDYNLFSSDIGEFKATVHLRPLGTESVDFDIEKWREQGLDNNSMYADPLFEDAANRNYKLKPESPALLLGFKEFDMDNYGVSKR